MKPIIGIISRPDILPSGNKIMYIYEDIKTSVIKSGGIPLGILSINNDFNEDIKRIVDMCDGIILQGGDNFYKYDLEILKYVYDKNIPVLGICLGMQLMGYFSEGKITNVKNHNNSYKKYVHEVYIDKNSKLYDIIKVDKIKVNSRHKDMIINPNIDIVGFSNDGVIEAIEDKKKKFFIGVQWHPENMYSYDILERRLFNYFVLMCRK